MDDTPSRRRGAVALAGSIAGDAMADPIELAELFDVDVDEFTGMFALIAADRLGRLQRLRACSDPVAAGYG